MIKIKVLGLLSDTGIRRLDRVEMRGIADRVDTYFRAKGIYVRVRIEGGRIYVSSMSRLSKNIRGGTMKTPFDSDAVYDELLLLAKNFKDNLPNLEVEMKVE